MSTFNPKTRRVVTAGLMVALGLMAPMGAAVADDTAAPPPMLEPQDSSYVYVDPAGAGVPGTYNTIHDALANVSEGGTIVLASDITMSQGLYIEKDVLIDLAGHSIVGPTNEAYSHAVIQVSEGHSLTIDGGGSITTRHEHVIIAIGSLSLRDCTLVRKAEGDYPCVMVTGTAGSATIDGATIVNAKGPAVRLVTDGCALTVLDGHLAGSSGYYDVSAPDGASISISGGTFSQPVRANWCESGYLPRMVTYDVPADGYTVGVATARPTAVNRTFNGTPQFGAEEGTGYVLSGSARDAGTHTTTAMLESGYAWDASLDNGLDPLLAPLESDDAESRRNTAPFELAWTMSACELDPSMAAAPNQTFDGSAKTPLTISIGGVVLREGVDYQVAYADNVAAGTATWKATGMGNCTGTLEGTFRIAPASIADVSFDNIANQAFTGSAVKPELTAALGAYRLELGRDYTVAYSGNVDPGQAKITVTGIGSFTGTRELTFKIAPASIADVAFDNIANQAFTGSAVKPALTAALGAYRLELGRDYTVAYSGNVDPGQAKITVTGIGSFTGTRQLTFKIAGQKPAPANDQASPSTKRRESTPRTGDQTAAIGLAQLALAGLSALGLGIRRRD